VDEDGILWAVTWAIYGRGPAIVGTQIYRAEEPWQAVELTQARVMEMALPIGPYTEDDIKIKRVAPDNERTARIRRRDQAIYLLHCMGVRTIKLADAYNVPTYAIRASIAQIAGRPKKTILL